MNLDLLRQRQEFMKKQINATAAQSSGSATGQSNSVVAGAAAGATVRKVKRKAKSSAAKASSSQALSYPGGGVGSSVTQQQGFAIMAKIVALLRNRHLRDKQNWPLSLLEAIEELPDQPVVSKAVERWLMEEAFPANQRVHVDSDGKLSYKPPYSLKNKQALQVLLKKNHQEGKGGITLSDLNDSIPAAEQNVKSIPDMIDIPTARREHVYFYDDPEVRYGPIDEEFIRLWKSVSVEHISERGIEEYLASKKLAYVKDLSQGRTLLAGQKQKRGRRKAGQPRIHNVHLDGILENYDME